MSNRWSKPMVDLHRGVQSYLIAKSSKEQVGYEVATDTFRRPPCFLRPQVAPQPRRLRRSKKSGTSEKVQGGPKNFLGSAAGWLRVFVAPPTTDLDLRRKATQFFAPGLSRLIGKGRTKTV